MEPANRSSTILPWPSAARGGKTPKSRQRRDIYEGACKGIIWAEVDATSGYIEGFCVETRLIFPNSVILLQPKPSAMGFA